MSSDRAFDPARGLGLDDPRLAACADLALARSVLEAYTPPDDAQRVARAKMLEFVAAHPREAHLRGLQVGHLTASALLLDATGERALLTHHRKLNRWLQLGGHCDGDANLAAVALRECSEESGIADLRVLPEPVDLDIHPIPARAGEPLHEHLDTRFVVVAPPGAVARVSAESHELGWFTPLELDRLDVDESVRRLFRLAFG